MIISHLIDLFLFYVPTIMSTPWDQGPFPSYLLLHPGVCVWTWNTVDACKNLRHERMQSPCGTGSFCQEISLIVFSLSTYQGFNFFKPLVVLSEFKKWEITKRSCIYLNAYEYTCYHYLVVMKCQTKAVFPKFSPPIQSQLIFFNSVFCCFVSLASVSHMLAHNILIHADSQLH